MAKDEMSKDVDGLDDIDAILASLDGDEPSLDDSPKSGREAVEKVLKDTKDSFVSEIKNEPTEKIKKFLEDAIPRGIRNEFDFVKETFDGVNKVYSESAKELQESTKRTVDLIKSKIPEDSKIRALLEKVSSKLEKEKDYEYNYQEADVITDTLDALFKQKEHKETSRDAIKSIKDDNKFEHETKLTNHIISNLAIKNDFDRTYTINYYRKSIELKIKTLMVSKELLEATKVGYDTFKTQFEAIIKNTSLPDLVKYKNTEQLNETFAQKTRDSMADMFFSAATPLESMKKNIIKKASSTINNVKMGLSTGLGMGETASSMGDMGVKIGVGDFAGSELAKYIADFTSTYASRKLEDNDTIRDKLRRFKLMMADPKAGLFDMADKELDKNTLFSRAKARLFRGVGRLAETEEKSTIKIRENDPNQETFFDYRTKNSIVKIIPMLLSKIYGEVKSLRTGEEPNGIYYDYTSGKLEENKDIKNRFKSNIKSALSGVAGYNLDNFMNLMDSKKNEYGYWEKDENATDNLSSDSIASFKASILGYLAKGGSISPEALQKDEFLQTLSEEDRELFKSKFATVMERSKEDIRIIDEIKDNLYNIKTNTPFIDKLVEDMYKNGNIEAIQKLGILDYDEAQGIYTVNKDKYTEMLGESIKDLSNTDTFKTSSTNTTKEEDKDSIVNLYKDTKAKAKEKLNEKFDLDKKIDKVNEQIESIKNVTSTLKEDVTSKDKRRATIRKVKDINMFKQSEDYINSFIKNTPTNMNKSLDVLSNKALNLYDKFNPSSSLNNDVIHLPYIPTDKNKLPVKSVNTNISKNIQNFKAIPNNINKLSLPNISKPDLSNFKFNSLENISTNIRKTKLSELISLEKVDVEDLHNLYSNSIDKIQGIDFISYARSLGYKLVNSQFIRIPEDLRIQSIKNKMVEYMENQANGITGLKNGGKLFPGIKKIFGIEPGMSPLQILHKVLKKTREWDRKIMLDIVPKAIGKVIKFPFKALGAGVKKLKGSGRNIMNFSRVIAGFEPVYPDGENGKLSKVKDTLDKTRQLDKDILSATPGILGKIIKSPFSLFGLGKKGIKKSTDWFTGNSAKDKVKDDVKDTKAKIFGDQDGDGDKDGSWRDRFQNFANNKNKKTDIPTKVTGPTKDSSSGILGLIAAGVGLIGPKLFSIGKKITKGFGLIAPVLKKIFGAVGIVGSVLKKIFKNGVNLVKAFKLGFKGIKTGIKGLAGRFASKIGTILGAMGMTGIASKLMSTDVDIDLDKNGKPKVDVDIDKDGKVKSKIDIDKKDLSKIDIDSKDVKKVDKNKILDILKSFKDKIVAKLGPKASVRVLGTLSAKIASRLVPFAGMALLAYDATMIAKDMIVNNTSLKSAVSRQILGFDLFNEDEPVLDEDGNPIKPDEYSSEEFVKNEMIDEYIEKSKNAKSAEEAEKLRQEYGLSMEEISNRTIQKKQQEEYEKSSEYQDAYKKALGGKNYLDKSGKSLSESYGDGIDIASGTFNVAKGKESISKLLDDVSSKTGVEPNTLKTFAAIESGMNPLAKAGTSSASGLFQFIKSTWDAMLEKYGSKYGIEAGTSPFDPMANALMGAEYIKENTKILQSVKKDIGVTDLYMAHFLGPGGAKKLLSADTNERADSLLPDAAKANNSIFYKGGTARTAGELYQFLQELVAKKARSFGFVQGSANNQDYNPDTNANTGLNPETGNVSKSQPVTTTNTNVTTTTTPDSNVSKTPTTENMTSGFVPSSTTNVSSNVSNIKTESTDINFSSVSNTLAESLKVQISMDQTLKSILGAMGSKGLITPQEPVNNKEVSKSTTSELDMPDSIVDLGKKRFGS